MKYIKYFVQILQGSCYLPHLIHQFIPTESDVFIFSFLRSPSLRFGFMSFWVILTWLQRWWMARLLGYCKWDATFSMLWGGFFWWYVGLKRNCWTSCNVLDIVSFVAILVFLYTSKSLMSGARAHISTQVFREGPHILWILCPSPLCPLVHLTHSQAALCAESQLAKPCNLPKYAKPHRGFLRFGVGLLESSTLQALFLTPHSFSPFIHTHI